jgi:hypothetical protein
MLFQSLFQIDREAAQKKHGSIFTVRLCRTYATSTWHFMILLHQIKKPTANSGLLWRYYTPQIKQRTNSNQNLVRRPIAVM